MSSTRKRWVLSIGGLAVVVIVVLGYFSLQPSKQASDAVDKVAVARDRTAGEVAQGYFEAVRLGDLATAGALTDNPAESAAVWDQTKTALRVPVVFSFSPVAETGAVRQSVTVSWQMAGGTPWAYAVEVPMTKTANGWQVRWSPSVVHPRLAAGQRLAVPQSSANTVAVVDGAGSPLLTWSGADLAPVAGVKLDPSLVGAAKRAVTRDKPAASTSVALVDAAGATVATLFGTPPASTEPAKLTVELPVQAAAEAAVAGATKPTTLVAIRPSTGGILAVAAGGGSDVSRAFQGLYPPGSTFKVVTGAAVLGAGTGIDAVLPCPGSTSVGTRTIRNADFDLGQVPLRTAFAESCNTTFATLAGELPLDALPAAAARFGLAADFEVPGLTTQTGVVEPAGDKAGQAENSIGQGTVRTSPFGVALMSATVAKGAAVTPRLFADLDTLVNTGYQAPPKAVLDGLRTMMREVVTRGRGSALAPYGASGKTGTAQYGDGTTAHGWFTGYRGDVAFAVLVEDAGAAAPAVEVTGRFLAGLK
ncbi:penicillin-binding transpeptidase domain-containing protein [Actinokineospora sp. G85]|uniref:penicillin-binding transpeptidase domain-containing protein n=1 Tax=Actinokineospora sp. G85 TaxID=3406626 RepID=UPI003C7078CA